MPRYARNALRAMPPCNTAMRNAVILSHCMRAQCHDAHATSAILQCRNAPHCDTTYCHHGSAILHAMHACTYACHMQYVRITALRMRYPHARMHATYVRVHITRACTHAIHMQYMPCHACACTLLGLNTIRMRIHDMMFFWNVDHGQPGADWLISVWTRSAASPGEPVQLM